MRATRLGVSALVLLALAACAGDDDRKVEAADWCRVNAYVLAEVDRAGAGVPWDRLDEWVEEAPEEILSSTERAAAVLRDLLPDPPPPAFVEARAEIEAFAEENCPSETANPS